MTKTFSCICLLIEKHLQTVFGVFYLWMSRWVCNGIVFSSPDKVFDYHHYPNIFFLAAHSWHSFSWLMISIWLEAFTALKESLIVQFNCTNCNLFDKFILSNKAFYHPWTCACWFWATELEGKCIFCLQKSWGFLHDEQTKNLSLKISSGSQI